MYSTETWFDKGGLSVQATDRIVYENDSLLMLYVDATESSMNHELITANKIILHFESERLSLH